MPLRRRHYYFRFALRAQRAFMPYVDISADVAITLFLIIILISVF